MLATTVFVDFGFGFPGGLSVSDTEMMMPSLNGPQRFGPGHTLISLVDTIQDEKIDLNGDGFFTPIDALLFSHQVIDQVDRIFEPFDIIVQSASATTVADIAASLDLNGNGLGNRDAYIVAAGDDPPSDEAFGWALRDTGNNDDNVAFAFADEIIRTFSSDVSAAIRWVATTVAHQAGHTFGLVHTRAADNVLIADGDLMHAPVDLNADGDTEDTNENQRDISRIPIITRFLLPIQDDPASFQNSYDLLANPAVVGIGATDPAYITGTSGFDTITITDAGGGMAHVVVDAFDSASYTNLLDTENYNVPLANGLLVEAGLADDRISIDATIAAQIEVRGGGGNDELVVTGTGTETGSYTPSSTESDAGFVEVSGGAMIEFSEFEPVLISAMANYTFITPNAVDVLTVDSPAAGRNRITGTSDGVAFEEVTFFDVTNFTVDMATNDGGAGADQITIDAPGLIASGLTTFNIDGGTGNDVFQVRPSTGAAINVSGDAPVAGTPGVPPGDVLSVSDAPGATIAPPNSPDGTVTTPGRMPINFTSIESIISPDRFEANDSIATATVLGSEPFITLRDLSIHNADDEDFFNYTAHDTGKLIVRTLFELDAGDLGLQVQDKFGNVIASSDTSSSDRNFEEIVIPVVSQERYFVHVFGVGGAINNYSLEIENFAAPVPQQPLLHPDDDNGANNADNITDVDDPRVLIQADLSDFAVMGIVILSAEQADAGATQGAAVEVFVNGTPQGFAEAVGGSSNLFELQLESDVLAAGLPISGGALNLVTAAVRLFDGQLGAAAGDPAMISGRTQLSSPLSLRAVDVTAPRITNVSIPDYDLFTLKPSDEGPTPAIGSLTIDFSDFPVRSALFTDDALDTTLAENSALYSLVGDSVGQIAIESAQVTGSVADGAPASATVTLSFLQPLPDDRFTLTLLDSITDPAGNPLDGDSNAGQPVSPTFPSGDGVPGGDFVARFTVDSRPEIGVWAAGTAIVDTNGNLIVDPINADFTNRDIVYQLGFASDNIFAGNFVANPDDDADGFDKLAAYGRVGNQWRWMIDTSNDGVPDILINEPLNINGLPVAGNFDNDATNGDEVGVFDGTRWYFDTDHDFQLDAGSVVIANYNGFPIVGDFNGDGNDDLGAYTAVTNRFGGNLFSIDLDRTGTADTTFRVGTSGFGAIGGFNGFAGVRERPVAADMNADGYDDIGLWAPDGSALTLGSEGEWYFLVSGDIPATAAPETSVLSRVDGGFVAYTPKPFGNDYSARLGSNFAVPLVGNFDPPLVAGTFVTAATEGVDRSAIDPNRNGPKTTEPTTTTPATTEQTPTESTTPAMPSTTSPAPHEESFAENPEATESPAPPPVVAADQQPDQGETEIPQGNESAQRESAPQETVEAALTSEAEAAAIEEPANTANEIRSDVAVESVSGATSAEEKVIEFVVEPAAGTLLLPPDRKVEVESAPETPPVDTAPTLAQERPVVRFFSRTFRPLVVPSPTPQTVRQATEALHQAEGAPAASEAPNKLEADRETAKAAVPKPEILPKPTAEFDRGSTVQVPTAAAAAQVKIETAPRTPAQQSFSRVGRSDRAAAPSTIAVTQKETASNKVGTSAAVVTRVPAPTKTPTDVSTAAATTKTASSPTAQPSRQPVAPANQPASVDEARPVAVDSDAATVRPHFRIARSFVLTTDVVTAQQRRDKTAVTDAAFHQEASAALRHEEFNLPSNQSVQTATAAYPGEVPAKLLTELAEDLVQAWS